MAPRTAIPAGQQRICPHCGVLALDQSTHCPQCDEAYGPAAHLVPLHFEGRFWVGIQTSFLCRTCGHVSPLNHLDVDGSVTCLHCGIEQRFDPNQWWGALAHAHSVGDLSGPRAEGRFPNETVSIWRHNPFRDVGLTTISAPHEGLGKEPTQHALRLVATPGHPLCTRCRTPLGLTLVEPPELALLCPGCGDQQSYVLPDGVRNKVPDLVGVVGEEHQKGRRDVRLERNATGQFSVHCPACGSPVDVVSTKTLVSCSACHTTSRVTDKILRLMRFERPKTETWWVLFEGPSKLRSKLERTERKALARPKPRHAVPIVPDAPLGDDMMRPLPATPRAPRLVPILVGALLAVTSIAVVSALWIPPADDQRSPRTEIVAPLPTTPAVGHSVLATTTPTSRSASSAEDTAPPLSSSVRPAETLAVRWGGHVIAARGSAAKRGAPCSVEVHVAQGALGKVTLNCGEVMLYERKSSAAAESQTVEELFEVPGSAADQWQYRIKFVDTGAGVEGSQVTFNSFTHTGVVFSDAAPAFRVEFSLEPESAARTGPALFGTPRKTEAEVRSLQVAAVRGKAPIGANARCELRSHFVMASARGLECKVRLACGSKTLYGAGEAGYGPCRLDDGKMRSFRDDKESFRDSDAAFEVDLDAGTLSLHDSPGGESWSVELQVATP